MILGLPHAALEHAVSPVADHAEHAWHRLNVCARAAIAAAGTAEPRCAANRSAALAVRADARVTLCKCTRAAARAALAFLCHAASGEARDAVAVPAQPLLRCGYTV